MANSEKSAERGGDSTKLRHEVRKLEASTEEEVDALRVDLFQDDERPAAGDGSGLVVDDLAEAEVAKFTEVGPLQPNRGAESLVPGRDNTSTILRRHHPSSEVARSEDVVEGNLDEPKDDIQGERKVDEGTAA